MTEIPTFVYNVVLYTIYRKENDWRIFGSYLKREDAMNEARKLWCPENYEGEEGGEHTLDENIFDTNEDYTSTIFCAHFEYKKKFPGELLFHKYCWTSEKTRMSWTPYVAVIKMELK